MSGFYLLSPVILQSTLATPLSNVPYRYQYVILQSTLAMSLSNVLYRFCPQEDVISMKAVIRMNC